MWSHVLRYKRQDIDELRHQEFAYLRSFYHIMLGACYRVVSHQFALGKPAISKIVHNVTAAIFSGQKKCGNKLQTLNMYVNLIICALNSGKFFLQMQKPIGKPSVRQRLNISPRVTRP